MKLWYLFALAGVFALLPGCISQSGDAGLQGGGPEASMKQQVQNVLKDVRTDFMVDTTQGDGGYQWLKGDLDSDGLEDAIAMVYIVPEHMLQENLNQEERLIFSFLQDDELKDMKLWGYYPAPAARIDLDELSHDTLRIISYEYTVDDPRCCPSIEKPGLYKVKRDQLLPVPESGEAPKPEEGEAD